LVAVRDPFVAIEAGTDLRAHARALRQAWFAALSGEAHAPVRPVIEASWSRMAGAGLDPEHLQPRRALETGELEDVRGASPLREAMPALRNCLGAVAEEAEHVMVVCDAVGRVLWMEGHPRVRHRAEQITFGEGMLWTEDSAGTNAIGTALAIDRAVQVFSAEHFLSEQHAWWCSAAPVHDPVTGALLGVVDLSGPMRTAHPHSLALVMAAAGMAEGVLAASARATRRLRLRVLGGGRPALERPGAAPLPLSTRHAEILAVLALHPEGVSAEALTLHIYGEEGNPISVRAEMSRLRKLLGPVIGARPYRLLADVAADFVEVERALARGDVAAALAGGQSALLTGSDAPRIVQARTELEGALRRAALAGGPDDLWAWLQSEPGRDDPAALDAFLARAAAGDARGAVAAARLESLRERWGLPAR